VDGTFARFTFGQFRRLSSEGLVLEHKLVHCRRPLLILAIAVDLCFLSNSEQKCPYHTFRLLFELRSGFQILSAGTVSRNELQSFPPSLETLVRKGLINSTRCCRPA